MDLNREQRLTVDFAGHFSNQAGGAAFQRFREEVADRILETGGEGGTTPCKTPDDRPCRHRGQSNDNHRANSDEAESLDLQTFEAMRQALGGWQCYGLARCHDTQLKDRFAPEAVEGLTSFVPKPVRASLAPFYLGSPGVRTARHP